MTLVTTVLCTVMLLVAGVLCTARILRKGSLPDRLVALDLLLLIIVFGIAILTYQTGSRHFLDLLVVVSLLAFVGTAIVARFVERRGA